MNIWFRAVFFAMAMFITGKDGLAQSSLSFFPSRPATGPLHVASGTITDYGVGNKSGGFTIREARSGHILEFYVGWPIRIDGIPVNCSIAPKNSFKPPPEMCASWPANIKLGHTTVKVTYWLAHYEGEAVNVSDQIESLTIR